MLELRIQTGKRRYVAPHALREAIGAERALREIGDMIEYLMAELDMIEGDPDLECNGDFEPDGDDQGDIAWIEWSSRAGRHHGPHETMAWRPCYGLMHEDDEEDDAAEDDDPREDDDPDHAVDDVNCDAENGREPVAALSWGLDQSEPLPSRPGNRCEPHRASQRPHPGQVLSAVQAVGNEGPHDVPAARRLAGSNQRQLTYPPRPGSLAPGLVLRTNRNDRQSCRCSDTYPLISCGNCISSELHWAA